MKKNKDLHLNIIFAIVGQILALFINLVSKSVLRTTLGLEYLGLQSIYANFCDIFSFAFFGIGNAMLYNLYGPVARGQHKELTAIYSFFDKFCKRIGQFILLIGAAAAILVLLVVNGDFSRMEIVLTYTIYLLSVVIYNRFLFRHYYIIARQRRYVVTITLSVTDGIALAAELLLLTLTHSYALFLLCILLKNTIISHILGRYLKKQDAFLFEPALELPETQKKGILENVKDLLIYRVGSIMLNNTDNILISAIISTVSAGLYSNYSFIVSGVGSLVNSFYEAIVAKIGNIISTQNKSGQFHSFCIVSAVNLVITAITCSCMFWLMKDFILLWMGKDAALSTGIAAVVTFNYYLSCIHQTLSSYRVSAGLFQKVKYVVIIRGIVNLFLSILFGYWLGLIGILIATAISDLLTMNWYEPYLMYRYFQKSFKYEVLYQFLGIFLTACTMLITGLAVLPVSGTTWSFLFLKAMICAAASLICPGIFMLAIWLIHKIRLRRREE